MSQPNEPVQNYEVVSPALEAQVKNLLPSVAGYGGLLRATNTIIPVVDVSNAAEGSTLPTNLQQAFAFGSCTAFACRNTTVNLASTAGFWRVYANVSVGTGGGNVFVDFKINDGSSNKVLWSIEASSVMGGLSENVDFIVFLRAQDTLNVESNGNNAIATGNYRQLADVSGTLLNPVGFTFS